MYFVLLGDDRVVLLEKTSVTTIAKNIYELALGGADLEICAQIGPKEATADVSFRPERTLICRVWMEIYAN